MAEKRFKWEVRPKALPENQVFGEHCRFTVLTSRLIRMEYSEEKMFEDRASQSVFYRDFAPVSYWVERKDGILVKILDKNGKTVENEKGFAFIADKLDDELLEKFENKTFVEICF